MTRSSQQTLAHALAKVPEITLGFWVIKIAATTLADFADRSLGTGYAGGSSLIGTMVSDSLDERLNVGGLSSSRYAASAVLLAFIAVGIVLFRQQAASTAH